MIKSWDNVGGNTSKGAEINFLKFKNNCIVRIIDDAPATNWTHFIQPNGDMKGASVNCIGKGCPICELRKTEEGKKKYGLRKTHCINVLVRKIDGMDGNEGNGKIAILEKGDGVFKDIKAVSTTLQTFGMNPDINSVDILISKTGEGFNTKYSVTPMPMNNNPLTEEERALEKYDTENIRPELSAEQITQLMSGVAYDVVVGKNNEDNNNDENTDLELE